MVSAAMLLAAAFARIDRIDVRIVVRLAVEHVADGGGRRLLEFLVLEL